MNSPDICETIRSDLPALYECTPTERGDLRVCTPFLFPDRDLVEVFVTLRIDQYLVTDFGHTLGWLRMHSATGRLSASQRELINDLLSTLDVSLHRGQLDVWCNAPSDIADAIHRVGQAVVRIADLWHTFNTRTTRSIADEVDDWLRGRKFGFNRRVKRSGRDEIWTVDYEITAGSHTSLAYLLSSGSRAGARDARHRVFTGFSDLRQNQLIWPHTSLTSIIDDTQDVWSDEDFALLNQVSRVATWSRPDLLEQTLSNRPDEDDSAPKPPQLFAN